MYQYDIHATNACVAQLPIRFLRIAISIPKKKKQVLNKTSQKSWFANSVVKRLRKRNGFRHAFRRHLAESFRGRTNVLQIVRVAVNTAHGHNDATYNAKTQLSDVRRDIGTSHNLNLRFACRKTVIRYINKRKLKSL